MPDDPPEEAALTQDNRRTVEAYEGYARQYAEATKPDQHARGNAALALLAEAAPGATILEIGSGPGWDADMMETLGLQVRRTDVTQAFIDLQRARGKAAERLDLIKDPLGGPYDGVVVMYVLQHFHRALMDGLLARIAAALKPDGVFLCALRAGDDETFEVSERSGAYHVVCWPPEVFEQKLAHAGLQVEWRSFNSDEDGDWMSLLARKARAD